MNNVIAQILGGSKQVFDGVNTVADVRTKLALGANYEATVNGEPAKDNESLNEGDYVAFSQAVKSA